MVNELAPRPHNSGHWTIDACVTSQFEQLVRAICGLPLGSVERHSDAVMKNLIGDDVEKWREALADPLAKLHLYGKTEIQPGRKMGHVTRLFRTAEGDQRSGRSSRNGFGRRSATVSRSRRRAADARRIGEAAVEKVAGIGKSRRAVVEPVEHGRGVDPRQAWRALCKS